MKIRGAIQGISVVKGAQEDLVPEAGIPIPEISKAVVDTFQSIMVPTFPAPPGPSVTTPLVAFQGGQWVENDVTIAIRSIFLLNTGIMVVTPTTTDNSDLVLDRLASLLDDRFSFRFGSFDHIRGRVSGVVVQFEKDLEAAIVGLNSIIKIVNSAITQEVPTRTPVSLKRLILGNEGQDLHQITPDNFSNTPFVLERRAGQPFSENRYFSNAPLPTKRHLELLADIETMLLKGA